MEYTLTTEEVERIKQLTAKINENNDRNGAVATPYKRPMDEILADGFAAELAFSKISGLPFDDSIRSRVGGADFVRDGKTIDVKNTATRYDQYFIKAIKVTTERKCDFYAFVIGTIKPIPPLIIPRFEYIGFVTYAQVLQCEKQINYGKESEAYVIPESLIIDNLNRQLNKTKLRTDEEYETIHREGGYSGLTIDDMKWLDANY